ncbi:hypothetical protein C169_14379 [Paenibacillus sp. FSL R5-808]|nr:hypothetical protein C169_14379 [Paenibacillus sp. FSL R5-808]
MTGSAFVVYWRDAGLGDVYVCESDRCLWGEPLMLHRTQRYGRAGRAVSDRTVSGGIGLYPTSDPLLLLFARSWVIYRTHDRIGPGCI